MSKTGVSLHRIKEILDEPVETDAPDAVTPPMDGDIVFDNVSFRYDSSKDVVEKVSFTIPAGSTFAILGGTGSGKSTLMHLLNRLYDLPPEQGKITVGGVDIQKIKRDWVRSHVGMVLQEPFLFSKTIQENIKAAAPMAELEEIRHFADIAAVDDAIQGFAQGYDTIVGERGVTLSGGQKQRVAIARMLMQKTPIMVFDDSLSAVDTETDAQIRRALKNTTQKTTTILISHRVTTLMGADKILVLDSGRVSDIGTHDELIRRDGIYRRIYEIQEKMEDEAELSQGEPLTIGGEA